MIASATSTLRPADIGVLLAYVAAVVVFGCWFVRRSRTTRAFMVAGGALPGWAVGLSIFGTYLSSNTFLGVPGKAFGANWNAFVFSLSLPIAAWIAARFFVPFYRGAGAVSAYDHLERRFGPGARIYAVICYLLTQVARTGTIMFGVALGLTALTGWDTRHVILATGVLVTLYTLLGGIEAVIWTDVVQSIVLMGGAVVVAAMLLFGMPDGPGQAVSIAADAGKFDLGSFSLDPTASTFWVVLIYGVFINVNNFGIDQSFVQRYHAAKSNAAAVRSVWIGALLYLPISLLFFFIGSSLFSFYHARPELLAEVKREVAAAQLADRPDATSSEIAERAAGLSDADVGDKVLPHFIANQMPPGLAGLLIAAIFAAAMSSIDTSLNSSATVILNDVYRGHVRPRAGEGESMWVLRLATIACGAVGTGVALAMVDVKSVLDAWWILSGVFAGGMLGLFLLGLLVRRAGNVAAGIGVGVGVLIILWMTLSPDGRLPGVPRSPFHANLVVVFGTLAIFMTGLAISRLVPRAPNGTPRRDSPVEPPRDHTCSPPR